MDAKDYAAALQEPFGPEDIEWRIGRSGIKDGKVWAMALCYISNRAIQARLDAVFGPFGWQNEYKEGPGGGTVCGLSIREPEFGGWVTKWDGAQAPETEPVKGVLSDSMKRAAVQWGIGRYLYKIPEQFVETTSERRPVWRYASHKDRQSGQKTAFYWTPPGDEGAAPRDEPEPERKQADDSNIRRMKSRFGGECAWCTQPILKGEDIVYHAGLKAAHHPKCWDERVAAEAIPLARRA